MSKKIEQMECMSQKYLIKSDQTRIRYRFPFLVPTSRSFTSYEGLIYVQGLEFVLSVRVPHYPSLAALIIDVYCGARIMLPNINLSQTLYEYLLEIETHLLKTANITKSKALNSLTIIDDVNSIINDNYNFKTFLNTELDEIKIQNIFHYESHFCIIKRLTSGLYHTISHSLPDLPNNNNLDICKNIKKLINNFLQYLIMLENYYSDLDEIDLLCWVIDPEKPTSKDICRRIVIADNCSLLITLSPWSYGAVPNLTLLGPSRVTDEIRDCISRNIGDWDESLSLYRNLLHVLEIVFFPKKNSSDEERLDNNEDEILLTKQGECCICFTERLNGKLPSIVCENFRCSVYFHIDCLYEWLSSLPDSLQKWGVIKGNCPNCCERISCEIPKQV